MKTLVLRNNKRIWITDSEAEIVGQAILKKKPVQIPRLGMTISSQALFYVEIDPAIRNSDVYISLSNGNIYVFKGDEVYELFSSYKKARIQDKKYVPEDLVEIDNYMKNKKLLNDGGNKTTRSNLSR